CSGIRRANSSWSWTARTSSVPPPSGRPSWDIAGRRTAVGRTWPWCPRTVAAWSCCCSAPAIARVARTGCIWIYGPTTWTPRSRGCRRPAVWCSPPNRWSKPGGGGTSWLTRTAMSSACCSRRGP
ncbi:MAG: hypothetical protein AVDCRST_MAG57-1482, partial [uncultured Blastococcus sp.]